MITEQTVSQPQSIANAPDIHTVVERKKSEAPLREEETVIAQTTREILEILTDTNMDCEGKRVLESIKALPFQVEALRKSNRYDFVDYRYRLLADEDNMQRFFETKILTNPPFAEGFKSAEEFFMKDEKTRVVWNTFLQKIRTRYFDDLIYESMSSGEYPNQSMNEVTLMGLMYFDLLLDRIRNQRSPYPKRLSLPFNSLGTILKYPDLLTLSKELWKIWFVDLDISQNILGLHLNLEQVLETVRCLGVWGVRALNFWGNYLQKFSAEGMNEVVRVAGLSGIRSLDLSHSLLWEYFNPEELIRFLTIAGESEIREMILRFNNFWRHIGADTIRAVQAAGESGITSLNFWTNIHDDAFWSVDILDFVSSAGKSWIKRLCICLDRKDWFLGNDRVLKLLHEAERTGIRYLRLWVLKLQEEQLELFQETAKSLSLTIEFVQHAS